MTASTQHSNHLLEELVAEEIANQIDQIAEELQRELVLPQIISEL